jgi:hypothetical protein
MARLLRRAAPLLLLLGAAEAWAQSDEGPGFKIVEHAELRAARLPRSFLVEAFLKKVTRWPDGTPLHPVDLSIGSTVRRRFVERVLGRSIPAIRSYWQQVIFSGRGLPPLEVSGDADVLRYVRRNRGAIGYVSAGAPVEGVRVVVVE